MHLAIPEKRLFKNQQKNATASIVVTLAKGGTLDKSQVQGIIHLVSGSVEGLSSDKVTVIDSNGKILEGIAKNGDEQQQQLSVDMLVFQQNIERLMETRAQDLLDKTMGYGQAMVRVTASLDFAKTETTEELFDAEEPVIRSEQLQDENNGSSSTGGIPGVQSNLQGNSSGASSGTSPSSKSSRTTNYEISKTINKTIHPVGTIKNLSVSVLLSDRVIPAKDENSQPTSETRSEKELQSVETMVARALGLDAQRGDKINVTSMPFITPAEDQLLAEEMPGNLLYEYLPFLKIGLLSFGVLLVYFLLIRPIIKTMKGEVTDQNKTVTELEQAVLDAKIAKENAEKEQEIENLVEITPDSVIALRHQIMQNQVPTAYIIKNWINEG